VTDDVFAIEDGGSYDTGRDYQRVSADEFGRPDGIPSVADGEYCCWGAMCFHIDRSDVDFLGRIECGHRSERRFARPRKVTAFCRHEAAT
jgi:hypothetical protein